MEDDNNKKMVLGTDYETVDSMIKKCRIKSKQSFWFRVEILEKKGIFVTSHFGIVGDSKKRVKYWLKVDAQKIMDDDYFEAKQKGNTVEPIKENMVLGVDYETEETIMKKSKYNTLAKIRMRVQHLKHRHGIPITTLYDGLYYWSKEDANNILNYKKPYPTGTKRKKREE